MKKITLLTAPFFDFWVGYPYLSLPLLAGQLKAANYNVYCKDLALEFSKDVIKKEFIEKTKSKIFEFEKIHSENDSEDIKYKKYFISKFSNQWYEKLINSIQNINNENIDKSSLQKVLNIAYKYALLPYIYNPQKYNLNYKSIKDHCFDKNSNFFIEYLEEKIKEIPIDSDLICISILPDFEIYPTLTLARLLKKTHTNSKIVLGGYWFTDIQEHLKGNHDFFDTFCDYVLVGNGENSIVELAELIENKRKISEVSGLIYKNNENIICKNEEDFSIDINKIHFANYDDYNLDAYFSNTKTLSMMITKGCYWGKCRFCSYTKNQKYQIKKVEKVVQEIKYYQEKYEIEEIHFVDDAIPPAYYYELAKEIIKNNIKIKFTSFAIFDEGYTYEVLRTLKQAGLELFIWGLETHSKNLFNIIQKSGCFEKRAEILNNAHKAGILNMINLIDNLPLETPEDIAQTVLFLNKNIENIDLFTIQRFQLRLNTDFAKNPIQYGLKINNQKEDFSLYFKYKKTDNQNNNYSLLDHYIDFKKHITNEYETEKQMLKAMVKTYIQKHQELFDKSYSKEIE